MKILLSTVFLIYYAISVNGNRVKRGLSADEQKKLVDEVNKDRQMFAGKIDRKMERLTYDLELEKIADSLKSCVGGRPTLVKVFLKTNDVGHKLKEYHKGKSREEYQFFFVYPDHKKFGCSKTFKCSLELGGGSKAEGSEVFNGKTLEYYGICVFDDVKKDHDLIENILKIGHPSIEKYGDIIGVVGTSENTIESSGTGPSLKDEKKKEDENNSNRSSGTVFNLLFSLFLVFYL